MNDFKYAYVKLTLWYLLIVMTISLSFSVYLYMTASKELDRGFRRQVTTLRGKSFIPGGPMGVPSDLEKIIIDQLNESEDRLILNLVYANLLILILAGVGSYTFARRTLHPIEEMLDLHSRFTADASHELRTPLTAMRTEIEVNLRDKDLKAADARKLLESNLEEIGKLESLSNSLLKLSRYESNPSVKLTKIQLSSILVEAYERVASLARKKSIEITMVNAPYASTPETPENGEASQDNCSRQEPKAPLSRREDLALGSNNIQIRGDKQSLVELFVILLDNAIKYSPTGSKVSINTKSDSKHAVIAIKDRGIGIKASDLPYIFNRFYRADTSRNKEKVSGYGLGLSIAKRIAELNKADITALSKPGKGSTFVVRLNTASNL